MRKLRTFCAILPSLSVSLALSSYLLLAQGLKWRRGSVTAALRPWHQPLTSTESIHQWKHTQKIPKKQRKKVCAIFRWRSRGDRVNSTVGCQQCGCCLLWCGWPFQHHVALQDSDKTSCEVTKCPCGGHNTHTGDTHRGKTHTGGNQLA